MRKILLLCGMFAFVQWANAQSSKIPDAVKTAFSKAYPNAKDVDWEKEGNNFEAEMDLENGKEMSLVFDAKGKLLETEVEIAFTELPKPVQDALKGKKVKETSKITNSSGVVTYEAEVKRKDLLFDAQGKAVK